MNPNYERHPWSPYIPEGARILILGAFPPPANRWSFDFYYPNRTNDFWKVFGLIFKGDIKALLSSDAKIYNLDAIKSLLQEQRIALGDSALIVHRLKGNASDKYLEVIEPLDLEQTLAQMPHCRDIATTGEKAATVIAALTGTEIPRIGSYVTTDQGLRIWRMPSTSRAYPLAPEKKAEFYAEMFRSVGIL